MNDSSKKYSQMHKPGEYITIYHPQGGLSAAGRIIEWDSQNHSLRIETIPRYIMTDKGFVNNIQMKKNTVRFDPTGHMIKELHPERVREEYPINLAIELRGKVVRAEYGQREHTGILAEMDSNYFKLQPHIDGNSESEPEVVDTARLIPVQGTPIIQVKYTLEEIVENIKQTKAK